MPVELEFEAPESVPIDVREISTSLAIAELGRTRVHVGNKKANLLDVCRIRGNYADDRTLVWTGELSKVHWIGFRHSQGRMLLEANAGDHVGGGMSGGEIECHSVGDYAACEMTGGRLTVNGDAGDYLGAALPGSKFGMNRGIIRVVGSVGQFAGSQMRRGTLIVEGETGSFLGYGMLAGTIIAQTKFAETPGLEMKRGTIVGLGGASQSVDEVNFKGAGMANPVVLRTLGRWLKDLGMDSRLTDPLNAGFDQFAGDQLYSGRGELFLART